MSLFEAMDHWWIGVEVLACGPLPGDAPYTPCEVLAWELGIAHYAHCSPYRTEEL